MHGVIHSNAARQLDSFAPSVCPLSQIGVGVSVRIKHLPASPEVTQRLREIGLGEGQCIKLLTCRTNIICQVCNARLAISTQLARTILVEPLSLSRAA